MNKATKGTIFLRKALYVSEKCVTLPHRYLSMAKTSLNMKQVNNLLPRLWWILTGVAWLCVGYILITICVGLIVILCSWLSGCKNKTIAIMADIVLILYSLVFAIYTIMLICVASPTLWFAVVILIIAQTNIILCAKSVYKLIYHR